MLTFYPLAQGFVESEREVREYLSAEFLMGPHLGNNLLNLGITDEMREAVKELVWNWTNCLTRKKNPDWAMEGWAAAALHGLARVAERTAIGYGIRYEFGI